MKTSFMTHVCADWKLEQIIQLAKSLCYDGIEFRLDSNHCHGVEVSSTSSNRKTIIREMKSHGIEICCLATSLQCLDPTFPSRLAAYIDLAAELQCKGIRVFCGGPEHLGNLHDEIIQKSAEQIHNAIQHTAGTKVELWLETHDSCCQASDAASIINLVNHPSAGILYDVLHPIRKGEAISTTLSIIKDHIRHVHLHDSTWNETSLHLKPFGLGNIDLRRILDGLASMKFTGYLSGEYFPGDLGTTAQAAITAYKNGLDDFLTKLNRPHFHGEKAL